MNTALNSNAALLQNYQGMADAHVRSQAAAALGEAAKSGDAKRVEQAAQDFEAVFIGEMLKPMFEMIEVNDTFGGGKGEEVFRDFMVQEYGKMIAKQGGIGLADQVKAELIRQQSRTQTEE